MPPIIWVWTDHIKWQMIERKIPRELVETALGNPDEIGGTMRIHYSQEADALYIRLKETDIKNSDGIADDIIMDYDESGNVVGIEILSASQKADVHQLIIQAFEKVMVESVKVA